MWFKKIQRIDGSAQASCFFSGIKKTWSQQKGAGARASFNHGISTVGPNVASEGMRSVQNPGMLKRPKHWPPGMGEKCRGYFFLRLEVGHICCWISINVYFINLENKFDSFL